MQKLANKVAVITGGNSGIGLATARLFVKHGASVAITGRNQATLDSALAELGPAALALFSEASNVDQLTGLYETVDAAFGKIDVLVVNAGIYVAGPLADFTEEMFDQTSDINFKGVFFAVQRALPYLNDGASVILTTSSMSEMGLPTTAAYSATKAAVHALARSFSAELAGRRIRVNVLAPGPIDTPIIGRGGVSDEQVARIKTGRAAKTYAGRLGTAEEIAQGFLYLASDDSRFMVGGELLLDGGMRLK